MPDLAFAVENVVADADAAAPLLKLGVRITCADPAACVQSVALRCQVQIEATRRRYQPEEQARLVDLFGEPDRWSRTLRTLLWTHASVMVPSFTGSTLVELPIHCTFDFNVAATKYFHSLEHGEIPLSLQFSGTIFYLAEDGGLQVAQIPWDKEANYRLPVAVWQEMMSIFYPNGAWLRLRQDVFEQLLQYKSQRGIPTWEAAIESLLSASRDRVPS
jgi:Family of unknown function (DUF6084)